MGRVAKVSLAQATCILLDSHEGSKPGSTRSADVLLPAVTALSAGQG